MRSLGYIKRMSDELDSTHTFFDRSYRSLIRSNDRCFSLKGVKTVFIGRYVSKYMKTLCEQNGITLVSNPKEADIFLVKFDFLTSVKKSNVRCFINQKVMSYFEFCILCDKRPHVSIEESEKIFFSDISDKIKLSFYNPTRNPCEFLKIIQFKKDTESRLLRSILTETCMKHFNIPAVRHYKITQAELQRIHKSSYYTKS